MFTKIAIEGFPYVCGFTHFMSFVLLVLIRVGGNYSTSFIIITGLANLISIILLILVGGKAKELYDFLIYQIICNINRENTDDALYGADNSEDNYLKLRKGDYERLLSQVGLKIKDREDYYKYYL